MACCEGSNTDDDDASLDDEVLSLYLSVEGEVGNVGKFAEEVPPEASSAVPNADAADDDDDDVAAARRRRSA